MAVYEKNQTSPLPSGSPALGTRTDVRSCRADRGQALRAPDDYQKERRKFRYGPDVPGLFVSQVRQAVSTPPCGTSNTAHEEMVVKYGRFFDALVRSGAGSTRFGNARADMAEDNSFDITPYPEESLNDVHDSTYHKYGVLTYFGTVDPTRGITKDFMIKEVLWRRYSRPGPTLLPVLAQFTGKSEAYAVRLQDTEHIGNPLYYIFMVGLVEQMVVPDGVMNITTEKHWVYPGTIRRTVIERDGHLFLYTSGAGLNRAMNTGEPLPGEAVRRALQFGWALGNDLFGARAFRTLDKMAFKFVNGRRNGKKN